MHEKERERVCFRVQGRNDAGSVLTHAKACIKKRARRSAKVGEGDSIKHAATEEAYTIQRMHYFIPIKVAAFVLENPTEERPEYSRFVLISKRESKWG